ncbi:DUF5050 domain-containing protein [Clostridium sp. BL-8]|uniref:DUF5050 domain-containing protein n=1 Tax=Clostridium sp. BL-8 TaxID=349938 RepID=UPI00098C57E9|nr:DUF5050 domain-containing protein [Clostridium sp. BL-8]OOM71462.1 autolysin [Clostridium sp. BL-8]
MNMLKLTKAIVNSLVVVSVLALNPIGASAEWKQDSNGWWNTEGSSWSVGWKEIDGNWYYFGQDGYMKTGWIQKGDKWYYLDGNGAMLKNTTINGCKLDSYGVWIQSSQNTLSNVDSQSKRITDETEVINRKSIVKDGDWLYESGKLSKVNLDGTNKTYIGQAYGDIIGVADDWVYYVDTTIGYPGSEGIYKIKDNEKIKLTNDDYIMDAVLYKGSIYYALGPKAYDNNVIKGGLYKVDIDGKNKIQLTDQIVDNINIYKDFIYYIGNQQIFKMSTDGINRIKICDHYARFLKLSEDNIYFSNGDDKDKLYKISIYGTDEKKLNDDISWDIQVSGNWIYYSNNPYDGHTAMILPLDQTRGNIYKITINGTDKTKLNSEVSRLSEVMDGWIYYSNWSDNKFYKIKLDGSNKSVVNS